MSNPLPPPLPYGTTDVAPIAGRAKAARIALVINLAFVLIAAPLPLLLPKLDISDPAKPIPPEVQVMAALVGLGSCAGLISSIVAVVLYCMWIHRASRLAHRIAGDMSFSPGWAVGWYYIPFANLVMPYLVMQELWRVCESISLAGQRWRTLPAAPLVLTWWLLYVIPGIISGFSFAMDFQGVPENITNILSLVSSLVFFISGIFCLVIIRRISAALTAAETLPPAHQATPAQAASSEDAMFP